MAWAVEMSTKLCPSIYIDTGVFYVIYTFIQISLKLHLAGPFAPYQLGPLLNHSSDPGEAIRKQNKKYYFHNISDKYCSNSFL